MAVDNRHDSGPKGFTLQSNPFLTPSGALGPNGIASELATELINARAPVERIFWAIDLNSSQTQTTINDLKHAAKVISQIFPEAKIYPAHVIDNEGLAWDGESARARSDRLHPIVQEAMDWLVQEATYGELKNVAKPFVIDSGQSASSGLKPMAKRLASWAKKFHADAILTFTPHRTGYVELLVSSFTDHLLAESNLPIVFVNDRTEIRAGPVSDLIFATNFSDTCRNTFIETLTWAKHFKAKIRLFNKPEATFPPSLYGSTTLLGGGWSGFPADGVDVDLVNSESELWIKRASLEGLEASFERDTSGLGTAEAISSYCSQFEHPLIVMSTCHGPLESGIWGSVTRDVLHQSSTPILVLRG